MNHIPCAFVNSNDIVKVSNPVGYFVSMIDKSTEKLRLSVWSTVYYKHPEAPDDALLTVNEPFFSQDFSKNESGYSEVYVLYHSQKTVERFLKNGQ